MFRPQRGKSLWKKRPNCVPTFRKCVNPSCCSWHPPVCLNRDAKIGEKCRFRHAEVDGQPTEKSKNGGVRGSVSLLKVSIQLGCFSRLPPEQICHAEKVENWDQITLLQKHVAPHENSGKNGSIARSYSKVRLMSAVRALPDLRKEHKTKPQTDKVSWLATRSGIQASKVLMCSQGGVSWISSGHKPVVLGHRLEPHLFQILLIVFAFPSLFPGATANVVFRSIPSGHSRE